jgi:hypothetical protein
LAPWLVATLRSTVLKIPLFLLYMNLVEHLPCQESQLFAHAWHGPSHSELF